MARARIRGIPLYIDSKKLGTVTKGKFSINSGDEMQIGTDGYMGHSDGATTCKINPTCIVPVTRGDAKTLNDAILQKKYITAGLPVGGSFMQMDVRCISADYDWDFKSGAVTGDFALEGGAPVASS